MSHTFRKVPEYLLTEDEKGNKKIKKIDHKHGEVITVDGFYSHPVQDNAQVVIGNYIVRFDGVTDQKAKKLAKKIAKKRARQFKKDIENEEDN